MTASFQNGKYLAVGGLTLVALVMVPYVGLLLSAVGMFLLLKSMKTFSNYYQDNGIYQNSLTSAKYYVPSLIALGVYLVITAFMSQFLTSDRTISIIRTAMPMAVFMLTILTTHYFRKTLNLFTQKTGAKTFAIAGHLLLVGSILALFPIGPWVIFIAWAFTAACFFCIVPQQQYETQPF